MTSRRDPNRRLLRFARELRRQPTDAERKLWSLLRDRRLGGFKFRRQHPVAGYIVDFFCEAASTVVELDGGQHLEPEALAYDQQRSTELATLGVRVLRYQDHEVMKDPVAVARTILRILMDGK